LPCIYSTGEYSGRIIFEGQNIKPKGIVDTEKLGISIIHQELALVKELSILENIFLGSEITKYGLMDYEKMHHMASELLKKVKLDIDPNILVGDLGVGQQQLVEIAKSLSKNTKLLILDEPTAPLTESETNILLDLVVDLKNTGVSCIYISHKLGEVKAISDHVCVIRDGVHIGTKHIRQVSIDDIITMMVGREMKQLFPREEHAIGDIILSIRDANAWDKSNSNIQKVKHVNFELRQGEILGISGLVGAGRTELMECIYGCYTGTYQITIELNGQCICTRTCRDALQLGIAMVPEDRKRNGIIPILSVSENMSLSSIDEFGCYGVLNGLLESKKVNDFVSKFDVKTPSIDLAIKNLSGGNQQKAILARFLMIHPNVLILDEPTRGIDVGAKYEIYKLMFELVSEGISIIMVSSELPEILGISDRVLVMHEGEIKANLKNEGLTQERVMDCALSEGVK